MLARSASGLSESRRWPAEAVTLGRSSRYPRGRSPLSARRAGGGIPRGFPPKGPALGEGLDPSYMYTLLVVSLKFAHALQQTV